MFDSYPSIKGIDGSGLAGQWWWCWGVVGGALTTPWRRSLNTFYGGPFSMRFSLEASTWRGELTRGAHTWWGSAEKVGGNEVDPWIFGVDGRRLQRSTGDVGQQNRCGTMSPSPLQGRSGMERPTAAWWRWWELARVWRLRGRIPSMGSTIYRAFGTRS
jgi:hypothetical protein